MKKIFLCNFEFSEIYETNSKLRGMQRQPRIYLLRRFENNHAMPCNINIFTLLFENQHTAGDA